MSEQYAKRLTLIVSRADLEMVLREILQLGCVEFSDPVEPEENPEQSSPVTFEALDLGVTGAGQERIVMLGTEYTGILAGWISPRMEADLISKLNGYTCAWEIEFPLPDELETAPVIMKYPWFFGKFRGKDRRLFTPLTIVQGSGRANGHSEPDTDDSV